MSFDRSLRRLERLLHAGDFRHIFRSGRCFRHPAMRIHFLESSREFSRLGLVVGRKMGNAVVRNKVKRRLREVFRHSKYELPRVVDLIVVPNPKYRAAGIGEYRGAFEQFIQWYRLQGKRRLAGKSVAGKNAVARS